MIRELCLKSLNILPPFGLIFIFIVNLAKANPSITLPNTAIDKALNNTIITNITDSGSHLASINKVGQDGLIANNFNIKCDIHLATCSNTNNNGGNQQAIPIAEQVIGKLPSYVDNMFLATGADSYHGETLSEIKAYNNENITAIGSGVDSISVNSLSLIDMQISPARIIHVNKADTTQNETIMDASFVGSYYAIPSNGHRRFVFYESLHRLYLPNNLDFGIQVEG